MLAALIAGSLLLMPAPAGVSHQVAKVNGAPVEIITIEPANPSIRLDVEVANGFPGTDESFASMVKRSGAIVAVNGAYFDKYSLNPIGDIVVASQKLHRGSMGTAFAIREDGGLELFRVQRHKTLSWEGYRAVIACGPALVLTGKKDVQFAEEGFRDPHVTGSTQRMGIGILNSGKVIFAYVKKSVTFDQFADIMLKLGCQDGMNLDGGASLAMYYQGKYIRQAGRKLTNIFVVRKVG